MVFYGASHCQLSLLLSPTLPERCCASEGAWQQAKIDAALLGQALMQTGCTSCAGKPLVYISHGDQDRVLNVDRCSRRIVAQLQFRGYQVQYHEFRGGHNVPPSIASGGVQWFLQNKVAMGGASEA
jgi:predicted esterase